MWTLAAAKNPPREATFGSLPFGDAQSLFAPACDSHILLSDVIPLLA
jgi:hypothetical protein